MSDIARACLLGIIMMGLTVMMSKTIMNQNRMNQSINHQSIMKLRNHPTQINYLWYQYVRYEFEYKYEYHYNILYEYLTELVLVGLLVPTGSTVRTV